MVSHQLFLVSILFFEFPSICLSLPVTKLPLYQTLIPYYLSTYKAFDDMDSFRLKALLATLVASSGFAKAQCPAVWTDVAADLKETFLDSSGKCTDDARAAIRLAFHDCFPSACDGSIILANECTDRGENAQMVDICSKLGDKATQFSVGTADLIQFAAAYGIASCPGLPTISVKVGRVDSSEANPTGQIPGANDNATSIVSAFAAKGFSSTELVALVGAHSAAKDLAGNALDTTVQEMDTNFYTETAEGSAPASLNSDKFLSNSTETSADWNSFGSDAAAWAAAFVPA
ncbi:putative class II peroxidase [Daldinia vernicosa]|uniref:putative class II peroxidase n=1 Tax=Daldinia vernicosa TaxID=114800 RepID=UPI002007911D|nr:putative class II peroxidase [Daldinia vernicosa]KAI0844187.1 putative class II peroxidase [Daldinia vernicosa]